MSVIVTIGAPGAGKTTVLERTLEIVKDKYIIINYGDAMFKVAKDAYVKNRDELRNLPNSIQKKIQRTAAEIIFKKGKNSNIIVDTHCTIKTPAGYLPGLPMWVLDILKPDTFVLIEADSKEIINRRNNDIERLRDSEDGSSLIEHQEINRTMVMVYSALTVATVKIIKNHDNELKSASKDFAKILE